MNSKITTIYIVRHGESEHNLADVVSGHGDPALTENGKQQVHATKQELSLVKFDDVYSSDLQRAAMTAEIISGKVVEAQNKIKELREKYYGELEGESNDSLIGDREQRHKLPKDESWHYKHVPTMESDAELDKRLITQIESLATRHAGQTILIGSHGTAIRVILMSLQDKHYNEMPPRSIKNGGYVKLTYKNGSFAVEEVNGYN